jgi:hypothetical protein
MFRQDEDFHSIYRDGSYDPEIIDHQRCAEYRDLLRRARLTNSMIHSDRDGETHRIEILPSNAFRDDGTVMGYVYTTVKPKPIVNCLTDSDVGRLGRGESIYAQLGDNWHVFIQRPDYSD